MVCTFGLVIQEAYGMTENVALSHSNRKGAVRFGTVGQPYNGVEVRLGKDNEVQVKSDASMSGYYKEPALTAECFEDGYLRTGDEGSIDAEGYLNHHRPHQRPVQNQQRQIHHACHY
jgi:long-chain acyl-CoA synthetase